jgi:hypothetical protein
MKIFVASTGRAGTLFVSEVFRSLTGIPSFHEIQPYCIGKVCEEINNHVRLSKSTKQFLHEKVAQVKNYSKAGNYMESSSMFIKSYAELMLDSFDDVYCIYLYRNPLEVLQSWANKCEQKELDWFLQSHWPKNIFSTEKKLPFYENVLWQCFEVRERYYSLKYRFKKTYELDFRDLNNLLIWKKIFKHFGIKAKKVDRLPRLKKNELPADRHKTFDKILAEWDKPGRIVGIENKTELMDYIDLAKKATNKVGI